MLSDLQSLIPIINNTIYHRTAVAHIVTKYYLAADMARDGEIDLNYVPTTEMFADCFTMPLPKPAFLKQCAAMGMPSEMASARSEMVAGMESELHMEMALGMPSECNVIGHFCFEEIHDI